jgi:protocatechuate 3,4-dioxygenase beta subunit
LADPVDVLSNCKRIIRNRSRGPAVKDSKPCSIEVRMRSSRGWFRGLVLALTLAFATAGAAQPTSTATPTPGLPSGAAQPRPRAPSLSQPARDPANTTPERSPAGTSAIRGRVVSLDSGQPLRRVQIFISGSRARLARAVLTDADGRYEFKNLPADRYLVSAQKSGYVTLAYGQRGPRESGRPLAVADGERVEKIDFQMPRGGVITGRVVDELGEPLADVSISVLAYMWTGSGGRRLIPLPHHASTNDLGQYRLYGMPPGDYVISASYRDNTNMGLMLDDQSEAASSGYAPTFYPGTANAAEAQRVTVGIGQEVTADMQLTAMRVSRVSGIVVDASGQPIENGYVQLRLVGDLFPSGMMVGQLTKGGSFTISGVPPGSYMLMTLDQMQSAEDGRRAGFLPLTVGGEELAGIRLVMSSGATIRGRVLFEGGPAPALTGVPLAGVQVTCSPSEADPAMPMVFPAKMHEDGTFTLKGLFAPCRVGAMVTAPPDRTPGRWTVKAVRQGGADVTDQSIELSEKGTGEVEIVFTSQVTTLTGTVTGSTAAPVTDYMLVAFAEDKTFWTVAAPRRIRAVRPDQTGVFKAVALPPGDYLVAAVERLESGSEWDPEMLARLAPLATRVTLTEGATQTVTVKLSAFP